MSTPAKDPNAVALGRKGGLAASGKGAKLRWARTSPEERSAHAQRMSRKRWGKKRKGKP